jgi:Domain of unknown function (DUF5615)
VKLLLDHCVPRLLSREFSAHEVTTAAEIGWSTLKNGQLLDMAAAAGFDGFITVDKNFRHQQNLNALPLSVIQIDVPDTRLPPLLAIVPHICEAFGHIRQFRFMCVRADGSIETLGQRT